MTEIVKSRKNKSFEKENIGRVMREVSKQAEKLQTEKRGPPTFHRNQSVDIIQAREAESFRKNETRPDASRPHPLTHGKTEIHGIKRKRNENDWSLCSDPVFKARGERPFLSQCAIMDIKTIALLLEEYRKSKKPRVDRIRNEAGWVCRVTEVASSPHLSVFMASIVGKKVITDVMDDQGTDSSIMS